MRLWVGDGTLSSPPRSGLDMSFGEEGKECSFPSCARRASSPPLLPPCRCRGGCRFDAMRERYMKNAATVMQQRRSPTPPEMETGMIHALIPCAVFEEEEVEEKEETSRGRGDAAGSEAVTDAQGEFVNVVVDVVVTVPLFVGVRVKDVDVVVRVRADTVREDVAVGVGVPDGDTVGGDDIPEGVVSEEENVPLNVSVDVTIAVLGICK